MLLAVLTSSLRRAEDIVLAAEARAFHPEKSRTAPLRAGRLDLGLALAGILSLAGVMFL
jgi:energy-coupling factor transporter transmembrane protein EcfT